MILPYTITGIVSAYPNDIISTDDLNFTSEIEKSVFKRKMGVINRRSSRGKLTSKDLGINALKNLIDGLEWNSNDIDLLISITQTPDYIVPGNAMLYQKDLSLRHDCQLIDLNYGCTGFIQGLMAALAYGSLNNSSKIIVLVGDTDYVTSKEHLSSYRLMGDATCAIAIEKSIELSEFTFKFCNNGELFDSIYSPYSSAKYFIKESFSNYSPQIIMDGDSIHQYVSNYVIKYIQEFESSLNNNSELFFLHQPNLLFHQLIVKKMKWDPKCCPLIISDFGNVSSATIPLTIQKNVKSLKDGKYISLVSFGVGMSFAAVQMYLSSNIYASEIECI